MVKDKVASKTHRGGQLEDGQLEDGQLEDREFNDCEFRSLLDCIADKWSLLLIAVLTEAPRQRRRFSDLKKTIPGISQRMLTTTLRHLERDGLLVRHFFPEIPPRVEYELSPLGKSLMLPIGELIGWIRNNWPTIQKARDKFDGNKKP